jgi:hypothetical protein
MMALNYTAYYELTEQLRAAFEADEATNLVSFGDFGGYDRGKDTITPCAHIIPNPITINNQTISVSLQVFCYDILSQQKLTEEELVSVPEGHTNQIDALDTTLGILMRVLSKYNGRKIRVLDTFATMSSAPSFDPVLEEGNSGVCGWIGTLTFEMTSHAPKC